MTFIVESDIYRVSISVGMVQVYIIALHAGRTHAYTHTHAQTHRETHMHEYTHVHACTHTHIHTKRRNMVLINFRELWRHGRPEQ